MKKIIILLLISTNIQAQDFILNQGDNGVLIELAATRNMDELILERAVGNGRFKQIAKLNAPASRIALENRMQEAEVFFPSSRSIKSRSEVLWSWLQSGRADHPFLRNTANKIALGSAYYDANLKTGERYRYRINNKVQEIQLADRKPFHTNWSLEKQLDNSPISNFRWYSLDAIQVERVKIYRSPKGQQNFEAIDVIWTIYRSGAGDTIFTQMQDTSLIEEGQYTYLIYPIDRYGNRGLPLPRIDYTYLNPARSPRVERFSVEDGNLTWDLKFPERVRSLHLYRSRTFGGNYERIAVLEPHQRSFRDPMSLPMEGLFYYFLVNDLRGENRRSIIVHAMDTSARISYAPSRIAINESPLGIELEWFRPPGSVRGYYVYRRDGLRGNWELASAFIPASAEKEIWMDSTSSLLGGQVYSYSIVSESETYQKSDYSISKSIRIHSDESIPVVHHIEVNLEDDNAVINWENLFERFPALAGYQVYRTRLDQEETPSVLLAKLNRNENKFIDSSLEKAGQYAYRVVTLDIFGNESEPSQSAIMNWRQNSFLGPEQFTAIRAREGLLLKWSATTGTQKIIIYRATEKRDWELIAEISENKTSYLDDTVIKENLYQFKLLIENSHGQQTEAAYPISIRY